MKTNNVQQIVLSFMIVFFFVSEILAAGPTEQIEKSAQKLVSIVTDPALEPPEREKERNLLIRQAVDEIFDWEAFSQRALGIHWKKMTPEEKREFITLFATLLERTYMDKTRQYSGETLEFISEAIDGDYGIVKAKVITKTKGDVEIDYRVYKKGERWWVYDIQVEKISLVKNYRDQFNSIITRSSYEELVKKLKEKVEPQKADD